MNQAAMAMILGGKAEESQWTQVYQEAHEDRDDPL